MEKLFSPSQIIHNMNKLDQLYNEKLGINNLDERFFISKNQRIQRAPTKFTPFARQSKANHMLNEMSNTKKTFSSQKLLNFDLIENINFPDTSQKSSNFKSDLVRFLKIK